MRASLLVALLVLGGCAAQAQGLVVRTAAAQHNCPTSRTRVVSSGGRFQYWVSVCGARRLYEISEGRALDITGTVGASPDAARGRVTESRRHLDAEERQRLAEQRAYAARCRGAGRRCERASGAAFVGDELRECIDVEASGVGVEASVATSAVSSASADIIQARRPCNEQFAGREPIAMCSYMRRVIDVEVRLVRRLYRYDEALGNDAEARRCLEANGDWWVAPSSSDAFQRARAAWEARQMAAEARARAASAAPSEGD